MIGACADENDWNFTGIPWCLSEHIFCSLHYICIATRISQRRSALHDLECYRKAINDITTYVDTRRCYSVDLTSLPASDTYA